MNKYLSEKFALQNDIDCSDTINWNGGEGFLPVGNSSTKFTGTFDGRGYKIIGLYMSRSAAYYQGLFGYTNGAMIENVSLEDIKVYSSGHYIGGLVGVNRSSIIKNCSVIGGSVSGGSQHVGGLVGYNSHGSLIENSYTTCSVFGSGDKVGGLAGFNYNSSIIKNSYATGSVECSGGGVGGLLGHNHTSTIENCYSAGTVVGYGDNIGGLLGISETSTTIGSFWDINTSSQTSSARGTGKTTSEMQTQNSFYNWDFDNVWCIHEGEDYPYLLVDGVCPSLPIPTCTGCAVLSGDTCVAGDTCSGETPTCSVSENNGMCVCNSGSCDEGRQCSGTACVNCDASEGCGACGCGTSQKPTGAGSCLITNTCCAGECNVATGTDSCSYSDDACPSSACNRTTLSCCATSLPYWRSSACKACSSTSGLSGACTTQGMECNGNYNCVPCNANDQCTCDAGDVANGSGGCVTPACSDDSECGVDQCINAGQYNAFCTNCSTYSQIWYGSSCASCPAEAVYASGVCLCNDGKVWNRSTNSCFERGVTTSSGDLINLKRNNSNSATGRYDRIKSRMNRIRSKIQNGTGDK